MKFGILMKSSRFFFLNVEFEMSKDDYLFIPVLTERVLIKMSYTIDEFRERMKGSGEVITAEKFVDPECGFGLWSALDLDGLHVFVNCPIHVGSADEQRKRLGMITHGVWHIVQSSRGIDDAHSPTAQWCKRSIYDHLEQAYMERVLAGM